MSQPAAVADGAVGSDPPPPAVLDASVLYPVVLCDTLLRCAEARLYTPIWSEEILEELQRNLQQRIGVDPATRRIAAMRLAFPLAAESGYEPLIGQMVNHPKDRHVVALAVAAGAKVIVTANLRDFPPHALTPHAMRAQSPDTFLADLLRRRPRQLSAIIDHQAAGYRRPALSRELVLERLRVHAPDFVARLEAQGTL